MTAAIQVGEGGVSGQVSSVGGVRSQGDWEQVAESGPVGFAGELSMDEKRVEGDARLGA